MQRLTPVSGMNSGYGMEGLLVGHSWPRPCLYFGSPTRLGADSSQESQRQVYDFAVDVGVMWDLFTFAMSTVTEEIDLAAGRYRMVLAGGQQHHRPHRGEGGVIREGRFVPIETHSPNTVRGREGRLNLPQAK